MHTPPIFDQALDSPELTRADLRVWRAAVPHLDWVELRPLKLAVLEYETRMARSQPSKALGRLVALGFLVRGARQGAGPVPYRVPCSRAGSASG